MSWSRREFLSAAGLGGLAGGVIPRRAPAAQIDPHVRPRVINGVASGDPRPRRCVIWSRSDHPAQLWVEWSTRPDFVGATRVAGPNALAESDHTARLSLTGLPPGTEIHYRVWFDSLLRPGRLSAPAVGRVRTPPLRPEATVRFAWSGDTVGQGFGINPDFGGMRIYESIRRARPHVFVHCGDAIYADQPLRETKTLSDGRVWRNLVTPEKRKVAETLAEFRGNFRYNLLDHNLRAFQTEVAQVAMWDDHETKNNWWPGRVLDEDHRYTVKSCSLLAARARQAFFEYTPTDTDPRTPGRLYRHLPQGPLLDLYVLDGRSHRGSNTRNRQRLLDGDAAFFGAAQIDWLLERLSASTATWKVIASNQPLALLVAHGRSEFDGVANGPGPPLGRELEIARLLSAIRARRITGVVWITADVHYAAVHAFHPDRAVFRDFSPFWEFVAGPLNAATFGPNPLDETFGPEAVFVSIPPGTPPARSPLDGMQYFGLGEVDPVDGALTVSLHDIEGRPLWSRVLPRHSSGSASSLR